MTSTSSSTLAFKVIISIVLVGSALASDSGRLENLAKSSDFEQSAGLSINQSAPLVEGRSIRLFKQKPSLLRPSLFHVVKFPNDECYDSSNQSGTCYTPLECKAYGGTGTSSCAKGYGTCCIISRSCHNTTSQKVVYFKNPSYPQPDVQQNYCDLTIDVRDPDVCQVRLDFIDFQLDAPHEGECLGDKLTVSASGLATKSIPKLCGNNRNQHMFVNVPRGTADRSASILFVTNSQGPYRWHVRATQIDCTRNPHEKGLITRESRTFFSPAELKVSLPAPPGCLQYFQTPTGLVESFNFGEYLNNLDYAICIERLPSTCRVTFSASDFEFNIDKPTQPKVNSGVGDTDCLTDYLSIPGGSATGDDPTHDRFCGGVLHYQRGQTTEARVVSKASGPIVLRFHTDYTHDRDIKEGFRLRYEQHSNNCETIFQQAINNQNGQNNLFANQYSPLSPTPVAAAALHSGFGNKVHVNSPNQPDDEPRARHNTKKWKSF